MPLEAGQSIAHYRVVGKIGEGGMGEVYAAEDTRLNRKVALKVLPADVAGDAERRARFEREAQAVAALNHPNIVTIHSVEEVDGVHFLTMELVEGRTLGQLIPAAGLPVAELFALALPMAEALAAAHEQGITHRDLKPDNIMVDDSGRLKVLDFGLAKLREKAPLRAHGGTQLPTAAVTQEGRILGTAAYMSPEQAEGKPVDARSDVFSLGIILYQMATGRRPFQGDTPISTISSILRDQPQSITDLNQTLPRHLGRIVKRALNKDPQRRYQSALELRNEIEQLKEEIDSGELLLPTTMGTGTSVRAPSRRGTWLGLAAVGLAVTALAVVVLRDAGTTVPAPGAGPESGMRFEQVTQAGDTQSAAISPGGDYVAYERRDPDTGDGLWIRQVATGSDVQIVPYTHDGIGDPTFSPNGNYVYYNKGVFRQDRSDLYRIPVLGGTPQLMLEQVETRVSFGPVGRLIFGRQDPGVSIIMVAESDGGGIREVARREGFDTLIGSPAWSPDGTLVATAVEAWENGPRVRLIVLPIGGGPETALSETWPSLGSPVWLPDGSGVIASAASHYFASSQLWLFPHPQGTPRRLTHDLNGYTDPVLTTDGRTLLAMRREERMAIWVAPADDLEAMRVLLRESQAQPGAAGLDWTRSGDLIYSEGRSDSIGLSLIGLDGSPPRRFSRGDAPEVFPFALPDGRVLILTFRDGEVNIWVVDADGRGRRPITQGRFNFGGEATPDGEWLFYESQDTLSRVLWKMPLSGGEPVEVLDRPFAGWHLSPDGTRLAVRFVDPETSTFEIDIVDLEGNILTSPRGIPTAPRWGPDDDSLHYVDSREGVQNLFAWPLDGSQPTRLTSFDDRDLSICGWSWSMDGKYLAVVRCRTDSDAVIIRDFR